MTAIARGSSIDLDHGGRPGEAPGATTRWVFAVQRFAKSAVVHVAFAFLAMGGWALFANRAHGLAAAWPAALAQGLISGAITLALKRVLETLAGRLAGAGAYVLPPLMTASVILAVLVLVHRLIGTPEIASTIAAPWSVSSLYAILYAAALARERETS